VGKADDNRDGLSIILWRPAVNGNSFRLSAWKIPFHFVLLSSGCSLVARNVDKSGKIGYLENGRVSFIIKFFSSSPFRCFSALKGLLRRKTEEK